MRQGCKNGWTSRREGAVMQRRRRKLQRISSAICYIGAGVVLTWGSLLHCGVFAKLLMLTWAVILIENGWLFDQESRKAASTLLRQDGKGGNYEQF